MNRKIDYKINENDTGKTVEGFLKEHGYTHQVLVRLKQTDHGILRNGIWTYTNERLCKDDLITVQIVENECSDNIASAKFHLRTYQRTPSCPKTEERYHSVRGRDIFSSAPLSFPLQ